LAAIVSPFSTYLIGLCMKCTISVFAADEVPKLG
jgi:hypothetical protein